MKRSVIKWSLLLLFALTIAKVNANGWTHKVDTSNGKQINHIFSAQDGGFWAIGFQYDIQGSTSLCQQNSYNCYRSGGLLQKYDTNGNTTFEKTYFSTNITEKLRFVNLIDCKDGSGLLIVYELVQWKYINLQFSGWQWAWDESRAQTIYAKVSYNGDVINANINGASLGFLGLGTSSSEFMYEQNSILDFDSDMSFVSNTINGDSAKYDFSLRTIRTNYNAIKQLDTTVKVAITIPIDPDYGFYRSNRFCRLANGNYVTFTYTHHNDDFTSNLATKIPAYLITFNPNNNTIAAKRLPFNIMNVYDEMLDCHADSTNIYFLANVSKRDSTGYKYSSSIILLKTNYNGDSLGKTIIYKPASHTTTYLYRKEVAFRKVGSIFQIIFTPDVETHSFHGIYNIRPNMSYTFQKKHARVIDNSYSCTTTDHILLKDNSIVSFLYYMGAGTPAFEKLESMPTESKISGTVFGDKNNNCTSENSDAYLRNYALRAINSRDSFYTSTDTLGNYEMYLDSGNYQLQLLPNPSYPLWKLQSCSIPSIIQLNDDDSAKVDVGLTPTISCTNLTVSLTAPFLRRCFENTYYINYCNNGTVNATNAYIDVALDHFLDFNSSAQAFTNLGNNVFRFHVGNVETGKCGAFSFNVTVNCDSTILGQTHCTEAHIFPDTVCSPTPYTGAIIQASATCKTNKVEFKLKNIGGNMQGDRKYIVIQDQVLRSIQNYNLPGGNELIVDVPLNNGSTYRIEAEQPANFPSYLGDPRVAAFVEGCRNNTSDTFTTGIISQFPLFDGEPYRAIDCQQNRGSYDPNDKAAKPTGVGAEHFIDKNIPLDYTIRFQNTGTDTAFTVSVMDTISPYLDINSIELEASSHKCNMIRIDSNVIQFLFKEIKLADSTTNLNASNGFVQFHIQQKRNNAIGTQINNFASIYFDYNPAILTNTVFHTIGENYLRVDLISTTKNEQYKNIELTVFPNPFAEKATLLIKNAELKNPILFLMDISGRLVDVVSNNRNEITIYRNKLSAGFYTYKLMDGNTEVATGKIIVQ